MSYVLCYASWTIWSYREQICSTIEQLIITAAYIFHPAFLPEMLAILQGPAAIPTCNVLHHRSYLEYMFCILKSLLGQVPKKTKQVLVHTSYRSIWHKRSKLWHEYPAHATRRRAKTFLFPKLWKIFLFSFLLQIPTKSLKLMTLIYAKQTNFQILYTYYQVYF